MLGDGSGAAWAAGAVGGLRRKTASAASVRVLSTGPSAKGRAPRTSRITRPPKPLSMSAAVHLDNTNSIYTPASELAGLAGSLIVIPNLLLDLVLSHDDAVATGLLEIIDSGGLVAKGVEEVDAGGNQGCRAERVWAEQQINE